MKKKVLIFGGGSYTASQIFFALKNSLRFEPILASSNDNHSRFICKNAILNLPYDSSDNFIKELNGCIREHNIDFIIPTHDTAALKLMENSDKINAVIVCSSLETTRICRYKSLTYKILNGLEFIPQIYNIDDDNIKFPIFAKDDIGQGGRNAICLNCKDDIINLNSQINYIFCDYLPGEEITIDCFTDRNGKLRYIMPRSRERLLNGISARAQIIPLTDEIKHIVTNISSRIVFHGYWFVQCKKDIHGKYKLMEISTRFAGTFGLSKNLDVNLPLIALQDFSNIDIDIIPNNYQIVSDKQYIDRYQIDYKYSRVYIDFDDTLVFNRRFYNTEAIRFLYQCINQKKELILITKHAHDLKETAKNIRFNLDIFDKIIEVPLDSPKYLYMNNESTAIFIDNAFSERKAVKEQLGIPTFDISNIEALIDWSD